MWGNKITCINDKFIVLFNDKKVDDTTEGIAINNIKGFVTDVYIKNNQNERGYNWDSRSRRCTGPHEVPPKEVNDGWVD